MHFSSEVRFAVQNMLVGLDNEMQRSLSELAGGQYFLHTYEDSMAFHASMGHKLPTRYVRDIIFWSRLEPGVSFAAEPLQNNEYGIEFIFFENSRSRYELDMSSLLKEKVCLRGLAVWRFNFPDTPALPSYSAVDYQYLIRLSTDDSLKWKALERSCN